MYCTSMQYHVIKKNPFHLPMKETVIVIPKTILENVMSFQSIVSKNEDEIEN